MIGNSIHNVEQPYTVVAVSIQTPKNESVSKVRVGDVNLGGAVRPGDEAVCWYVVRPRLPADRVIVQELVPLGLLPDILDPTFCKRRSFENPEFHEENIIYSAEQSGTKDRN